MSATGSAVQQVRETDRAASGTSLVPAMWAVLAVALILASVLITLRRPFNQDSVWVSSHMAVMARSYLENGFFRLHGLPVQNNPPLGTELDAYIHWPPLFVMLLAGVFRIFGESVTSARVLMLLLTAGLMASVFYAARLAAGRNGALWSLVGMASIPFLLTSAPIVWALSLTLTLMVIATACFIRATDSKCEDRRFAYAGVAAVFVGTLFSWEAMMLGPALWLVSLAQRSRRQRRLALVYVAAAAAAFALVMVWFALAAPEQMGNLWNTALFRLSLGYGDAPVPLYALADRLWYGSHTYTFQLKLTELVQRFLLMRLPVLLAGVAVLLWTMRRPESERYRRIGLLVGGMIGAWALWYVVFANHAFEHVYEMELAVPGFGAALGIAIAILTERFSGPTLRGRTMRAVLTIVLPVVLLVPTAQAVADIAANRWRDDGDHFAAQVREHTTADDVVLITSASMAPVYDSHRHTIRFVYNEWVLQTVMARIGQVQPGRRVYLALGPRDVKAFPQTVKRYPAEYRTDNFILIRLR